MGHSKTKPYFEYQLGEGILHKSTSESDSGLDTLPVCHQGNHMRILKEAIYIFAIAHITLKYLDEYIFRKVYIQHPLD